MSCFDSYKDRDWKDIIGSDIDRYDLPSSKILLVFKQCLTEQQIETLDECLWLPTYGDINSYSASNRHFIRCEVNDVKNNWWFFPYSVIPLELANLLSYLERSVDNKPTVVLTASESLINRERLIRQTDSKLKKELDVSIEEGVSLLRGLAPVPLENNLRSVGKMDIFTAELIASHFFLNPSIVMPIDIRGYIVNSRSRIKRDDILKAFELTKKILLVDEYQKVKIYPNSEKTFDVSDIDIKSWLEHGLTHDIIVRTETDDSDHHIYCIIRFDFALAQRIFNQLRILAFI